MEGCAITEGKSWRERERERLSAGEEKEKKIWRIAEIRVDGCGKWFGPDIYEVSLATSFSSISPISRSSLSTRPDQNPLQSPPIPSGAFPGSITEKLLSPPLVQGLSPRPGVAHLLRWGRTMQNAGSLLEDLHHTLLSPRDRAICSCPDRSRDSILVSQANPDSPCGVVQMQSSTVAPLARSITLHQRR